MARLTDQGHSKKPAFAPIVRAGLGRVALAAGIAILVIWLTRIQTTDQFAQTMIALSLVATGAIGGAFGSNRLLLRELAPLAIPSNASSKLIATATRSASITTAISAVVTTFAIGVIVGEWSPLLLIGSAAATSTGALLYVVSDGLRATSTARGRWASELTFGRYGGAAPVWAWLATLFVLRPTDPGAIIALLALVSAAIGLPLLLRLRAQLSTSTDTSRSSGSDVSVLEFLGNAVPFGLSQLTGLIIGSADLWVGALVLGRNELAFYAAARQLLMLVALPLQAAQLAFVAPLARTAANGSSDELQALVTKAARRATPPAILAGLILVLVPKQLLGLAFPDGYEAAGLSLVILATGQMFNAFTGLCGQALSMSGHERVVTRVNIAAALGLPILALGGAQLFGIAGLALSVMTITFALFGSLWWIAKQQLGVQTQFRLIDRTAIASARPLERLSR